MTETNRPCSCNAELIGLSDGSSVHAWLCSKCNHHWPRQITVRGLYKYRQVCSENPHTYPSQAEEAILLGNKNDTTSA